MDTVGMALVGFQLWLGVALTGPAWLRPFKKFFQGGNIPREEVMAYSMYWPFVVAYYLSKMVVCGGARLYRTCERGWGFDDVRDEHEQSEVGPAVTSAAWIDDAQLDGVGGSDVSNGETHLAVAGGSRPGGEDARLRSTDDERQVPSDGVWGKAGGVGGCGSCESAGEWLDVPQSWL